MQRLSLSATLPLLKKIARILAVSAGMLVLLIVGIVCLGIYLNHRAAADAQSLCDRVHLTSPETEALAIAASTRARHVQGTGKHLFGFQGWLFNAVSCEVTTSNGRITGKRVVEALD